MAFNLSAEEVSNLGLTDLVSTRIRKGGRNPGMTTAEIVVSQTHGKLAFDARKLGPGNVGEKNKLDSIWFAHP